MQLRKLIVVVTVALVGCQSTTAETITTEPVDTTTAPSGLVIDLDQVDIQSGYPHRVDVSPDGSEVVVFSDEPDLVRFYDLETGVQSRALEGQDLHWSVGEAMSADWKTIGTRDTSGDISVMDVTGFEVSSTLEDCDGYPWALSADGNLLFACSRVINLATGATLLELADPSMHDAVFDPSGGYLVLVKNEVPESELTVFEIYDLTTGALLPEENLDQALRLSFDPSGKYLAIGNLDGTALVVDFASLTDGTSLEEATVTEIDAHDQLVIDIELSSSGLLATSSPGSVAVWDIESAESVAEASVGTDFWTFIGFGPEGDYLLYSADQGHLKSLAVDDTQAAVPLDDSTVPVTAVDAPRDGTAADLTIERLPNNSVLDVTTPNLWMMDGHYYGHRRPDLWFESEEGATWSRLDEAPAWAPPAGSASFRVFVDDGDTYATIHGGSAPDLTLMQRVDGIWVDVPITVPSEPPGVDFVADTDSVVVGLGEHRSYSSPTFVSTPSMVVMRDNEPMAIVPPWNYSTGVVTAGGHLYGVSKVGSWNALDGFRLWRSEDGVTWSEMDVPALQDGNLVWAYLTAGHDRLMLNIGHRDGARSPQQRIWTSVDGVSWDEVAIEQPGLQPLLPQATDFGWMIISLKRMGPLDPLYDVDGTRIWLSVDGLNWSASSVDTNRPGFMAAGPFKVNYAAGLFLRQEPSALSLQAWRLVTSPDK